MHFYMILGKGLIPSQVDDAVFHCFLPMLDKTGFAFKINADFSTRSVKETSYTR